MTLGRQQRTERLLLELAEISSFSFGERVRYQWQTIESRVGVRFPSEYRAYAEAFPPGAFNGLKIYHPQVVSGLEGVALENRLPSVSRLLQRLAEGAEGAPRYVAYPEP